MDNVEFDEFLNSTQSNIDWTIDNALKRGYKETFLEVDDYSALLEKYEFRNLIVFEYMRLISCHRDMSLNYRFSMIL